MIGSFLPRQQSRGRTGLEELDDAMAILRNHAEPYPQQSGIPPTHPLNPLELGPTSPGDSENGGSLTDIHSPSTREDDSSLLGGASGLGSQDHARPFKGRGRKGAAADRTTPSSLNSQAGGAGSGGASGSKNKRSRNR